MAVNLRIANISRNSILATHAKVASTPEARRMGLLGVSPREFGPGNGLWFPECNSIHTIGMSFPIDVLFVDILKRRIVRTQQNTAPGCNIAVIIPQSICAVLELPPGTIEITGTQTGDLITLMSSAHCSQDELNRIASL